MRSGGKKMGEPPERKGNQLQEGAEELAAHSLSSPLLTWLIVRAVLRGVGVPWADHTHPILTTG